MLSRILGDKKNDYPSDPIAGTYGYGQNVLGTTVTTGIDVVEAIQIAKLKSDVLKVATHCGLQNDPLVTALPTVTSGSIILASHFTAYKNCLDLLTVQRFALGADQYSDELITPNLSSTRVTPWGNNLNYNNSPEIIRHSFTLDFTTPERARYFFNAGSSIRFTASRTGGTVSSQNSWWSSTLGSLGTIIFNHNSTDSTGAGTGSGIGFYQLTNNAQTVFTSAGAGSYSSYYYYYSPYRINRYYITASCDIASNSNGGARYIYFNVYFDDNHVQSAPRLYSTDMVDGTLSSNVSIRRASGVNVNVAAPTGVNTKLLSTN
jgi:hypothetical protein